MTLFRAVVLGCCPKASFEAAAAETVKLLLAALVSPELYAVRVYAPLVVGFRLVNEATPLTALTVRVEPANHVPPEVKPMVTEAVLAVTMLP
jgi:hypothetical protein